MKRSRHRRRSPGTSAGSGIPAAPTLDWDDQTNDATADFVVDFDETVVVANDLITMPVYTDVDLTTLNQTVSYTVLAGDIVAGTATVATSALANGTYYARASVSGSAWSNTQVVTISVGGSVAGKTWYLLGF